MTPGRLIVIEGMDGTGKSTLVVGLAEALGAVALATPPAGLRPVRATLDDLYTPCRTARQLLYASTVLLAATEIRACLAAGQDVVLDRYWASTMAYARYAGDALALDEVRALLPCPTLTLWLDAEDALRHQRMTSRGLLNAVDEQSLSRSAHLRALYLAELDDPWHGRCHTIRTDALIPAQVLDLASTLCAA